MRLNLLFFLTMLCVFNVGGLFAQTQWECLQPDEEEEWIEEKSYQYCISLETDDFKSFVILKSTA